MPLALVRVTRPPRPPAPPASHVKLFPVRADVFVAGGRTFAIGGDYDERFVAWVDGGKAKKRRIEFHEATGVHRDGTRLLYAANKLVYEIAVPRGKPVQVLDCGQPLGSLAYGPEDTIVCATASFLGLFQRSPAGLVNMQTIAVKGGGLHAFRDGTLIVLRSYDRRVVVFRATTEKLVRLGSVRSDAFTAWEAKDRVFLEDSQAVHELKIP